MARQQKLIHLHGSTQLTKDTATAVNMATGELAMMNGTQETSELYVLTSGGDIATFVTGAKVTSQIQAEANRADAAEKANAAAIKAISDDYLKKADKTALQGEIDAAEERIATLEGKFTGEDSVAAQIQAAVAAEAAIARAAEKANADAIDAIEADYLKAADKTELNNLITGLTATVNANETDIETKMSAEIARATKAEEDLQDAIDAIEADYLKAADKTELQGNIDAKVAQSDYNAKVAELVAADETNAKAITAHTSNGDIHVTKVQKEAWQAATDAINAFMDAENVGDAVVNTLKEIQDYITTDGAAADTMTKNIADNAAAIDAIEADYLKAADKTELQGNIDAKVAKATYDAKVAELVAADAANAKAISDEVTRATKAEADLQDAIDAIAGEGGSLADTLQAAKDYTDGLLGDGFTTVNTVAAAIAAEANRADAAEKANAAAIKAISDDYLKAADKTELQGAINAVDTAYKAADTAFTTALNAAEARIKTLEDAGYVKTVSVQNSNTNKITATESADGTVTLNFDNMVIDCGTY